MCADCSALALIGEAALRTPNVPGPGAAEPLAGRSGTASRERQSPERACARERGQAWLRAAQRPGIAGAATERSQRSCDMRSMRAAQRRSRAGAQAELTHRFVSNPITRQSDGFVINDPQFGPVARRVSAKEAAWDFFHGQIAFT